ncbi:hypothetical protein [Vibrio navarrensis]|uniref:hypothetical protein n=1 Tax=Vibrio navarrensis TaxID=29495 RepID=UPI000AC08A37|nr:hypothetical protein [Vibrio navarrensis]EJK2116287.1 hypothetical protein [Vibrio navarrensis]QOD69743.1 hypothetical protein IF132_13340 [Vibrio navarrensis]
MKKGNSELKNWVNQQLIELGEQHYLLELYDRYVRDRLPENTDPYDVIVEVHPQS